MAKMYIENIFQSLQNAKIYYKMCKKKNIFIFLKFIFTKCKIYFWKIYFEQYKYILFENIVRKIYKKKCFYIYFTIYYQLYVKKKIWFFYEWTCF